MRLDLITIAKLCLYSLDRA